MDAPHNRASDQELVAAFEAASLPKEAWTHEAHVRVGFLYARQCGLATAISRMRAGLIALNAAHQAPDELERGYHETITQAFVRLIDAAASRQKEWPSSGAFCAAHPELLDKNVLGRFYSRDRLISWEAKTSFVEPDLAALP